LFFYAYQDDIKKKVSDFFEELTTWEGYLSKVFANTGFLDQEMIPYRIDTHLVVVVLIGATFIKKPQAASCQSRSG